MKGRGEGFGFFEALRIGKLLAKWRESREKKQKEKAQAKKRQKSIKGENTAGL